MVGNGVDLFSGWLPKYNPTFSAVLRLPGSQNLVGIYMSIQLRPLNGSLSVLSLTSHPLRLDVFGAIMCPCGAVIIKIIR